MSGKTYDFAIHRVEQADWTGGLRTFFEYRDLGLTAPTGGDYVAHIIKARQAIGPDTDTEGGTGRHFHEVAFQWVYVLKGWVKFWYEGRGEFTFQVGDSVLQPSGIKHQLLACSEDMEVLEIVSPADFSTEDGEG